MARQAGQGAVGPHVQQDNPGTLGKDTYVSILAYLLQLNGVAAGQQALVEDPPGVIPGR